MFDYQNYVDDLLVLADDLVGGTHPRKMNRAIKCRAVSTLYYALFSELSGSNADAFIGSGIRKAWGEVYRALEQCAFASWVLMHGAGSRAIRTQTL